MTLVRQVVHDLMRAWGTTTVFGNPGSNELPFLDGFPDDFDYVLGLHEGTVLAMADGFAQASGRPVMVNLHAAAGLGNAMGNLANARAAGTPLVVTAGQQSRAMEGLGSMLGEPQLTRVPEPHVKWSVEPSTAADVPRALSQAFHLATLPPAGPVFVSVPLDDWSTEVDDRVTEHLARRQVRAAGAVAEAEVERVAASLRAATAPVLVLGPEVDDDDTYPALVALADRLGATVWLAPAPPRAPFPTRHPAFRGPLPPSINGISTALEGADVVLCLGAPVFRYHAYVPGPWLPAGASLVAVTGDPEAASRTPFGDALVADPSAFARQLLAVLGPGSPDVTRRHVTRRPMDAESRDSTPSHVDRLDTASAMAAVCGALPTGARVVSEATSATGHLWRHLDLDGPRRYFFPAAGGLGFGLPAAVGVALADRSRPVVAVLGDGAAHYGITGLWSAVRLDLPVTFVVLDNGSYAALRSFEDLLGVSKVPGLELPGLGTSGVAAAYGMEAHRVGDVGELAALVAQTRPDRGPRLVEVPVPPESRRLG